MYINEHYRASGHVFTVFSAHCNAEPVLIQYGTAMNWEELNGLLHFSAGLKLYTHIYIWIYMAIYGYIYIKDYVGAL